MTTTAFTASTTSTSTDRAFWRPAAVATVGAAAATTAVAAIAHAAGISLAIDGQEIPVPGFATATLMLTVLGLVIAAGLRQWAANPRRAWVRTTVALTALSLVPDAIVNAAVETKLTLMLTHIVAAAIVIPVIAARIAHSR
ncbi:DUF6069 family protein [Smaragdicoccus niigatensis]|uniref:DUF6069 family protein n=1 Tax=Smaragdicoccus niigatensis TaxID=359359 RepID=UPI00037EBD20|nr:DUF6069 family protein [Smaragdicoccus niigatensis]